MVVYGYAQRHSPSTSKSRQIKPLNYKVDIEILQGIL